MKNITNELIKLRKNHSNLEPGFSTARSTNDSLRCEKLQISGIPTITNRIDTENKVLDFLTKLMLLLNYLTLKRVTGLTPPETVTKRYY